jgi:spore coat protein CotH
MKRKLVLAALIVFACLVSGCKLPSAADIISPPDSTDIPPDSIDSIQNDEKGFYDPASLNTGLPIISIETKDRQAITSKEIYIDAVITISGAGNPSHNLTETATTIRGRGNSTWVEFPKKPYRLKFPEKQELFGYPKAKSWVLLANARDSTLMMNTIALKLGSDMGLPYTNHTVHVELVLNGVYEGSYVLTEQVQVGKGRVDIDEDDGFLVELDHHYDEEPKFTSASSQLPVMIKSPEDLADSSGYDFVKTTINELDALLFEAGFPENGYRDLIDMDTFVKFLLVNEIVGNHELVWPASGYMYKEKDKPLSRICLGPLWDFDWAFACAGGMHKYFGNSRYRISLHRFFERFFDDPAFKTRYKEIWNEYYTQIMNTVSFIDETAAMLDKSQTANFTVWPWRATGTYQNEISRMKTWWRDRVAYLNTEINKY